MRLSPVPRSRAGEIHSLEAPTKDFVEKFSQTSESIIIPRNPLTHLLFLPTQKTKSSWCQPITIFNFFLGTQTYRHILQRNNSSMFLRMLVLSRDTTLFFFLTIQTFPERNTETLVCFALEHSHSSVQSSQAVKRI